MSASLIDIISKSSTDYVHNVSTLKSKKINDTNNYQQENHRFDRNKEDKFTNSGSGPGSFYDLIKKKKSTTSKSNNNNNNNRNNSQKEKSKIKFFLIFK